MSNGVFARLISKLTTPNSAPGDHLTEGAREPEGREGLEVRLLEGGEHPTRVRHLELGVEVGLLVGRIDRAVQPFTGARVDAVGDHPEFVALALP